jgi:hydrogenase/urease accessory protein HupE
VPGGSGAPVDGTADTVDVVTTLDLEYDLLMISAWLTAEAYAATERDVQREQLAAHVDEVNGYVTNRFRVEYAGRPCAPELTGADVVERSGRAYVRLEHRFECAGEPGSAHAVTSALFPDAESLVRSTETLLTYDLDGESGSTVLTAASPTLTTGEHQAFVQALHRAAEFFVLGVEHLLGGLDHVLFLLALVVAARRLRDVVLVATAFTVAHSVTFLLAATGVVRVPGAVVEPVIALSIAAVAGAYLWRLLPAVTPRGRWLRFVAVSRPERGQTIATGRRETWSRLGIVFAFGLVHGLGFAGALGVDEPWSWGLVGALLAFNVGVEAAQLGLIAVTYPLLVRLRRRAPRAAPWVTGGVAAGVALAGVWWFAERTLGA